MLEKAKSLLRPSVRSDVPPFMVMDVMAAAARLEAQGRRIVHMEVGQPATGAPATAIEAVRAALSSGPHGYTEALGMTSLRRRIARAYSQWHGLDIDPERIVVTTGSSAGFMLAFLAAFEAGDRVAVALPGYPPYRHILTALGCEPVWIETSAATRWSMTAEALLAQHRVAPLKGVVVASPANPTGTMMTAPALAALIRCAEDAGIAVISDEIYHGLDYAFAAESAARLSSDAIIINSFSKYFCMTGWRIGWMVVPPSLVRAIERLQQNLSISVPTLSQIAARCRIRRTGRTGKGETRATRKIGAFCSKDCRAPASHRFCRSTGHSISMPTYRTSRQTVSNSPRGCLRKRAWRQRRVSISIRFTDANFCACVTLVRLKKCAKRSSGSARG